jgi:hypothetical protein
MATDYRVVSTQPYHYQDATMRVVDGYRVYFYLTQYDETHYVLVPSLNPEAVKRAIALLIADRKSLGTV